MPDSHRIQSGPLPRCSALGGLSSGSGARFLLYSHDGLGLGHTRRNLAIARALVTLAPEATVLLATGADEINRYGVPPQVEVLKLPSLRKLANNHYDSRYLRVSAEKILRIRASLLRAAVESFQPQVLLVDKHPLGVGGELVPALAEHRRHGGRTALGLRDILDAPEVIIAEWQAHRLQAAIERHYDEVLIYGQPEIFDAVGEYRFSRALAKRAHYCGYVCNVATASVRPRTGKSALVLATPGGGEDGYALVANFITAAHRASWKGWAITGPMMPERQQQELRQLGGGQDIQIDTFLPNLARELADISSVVCMGGYNTLTEVAALSLRAVCVPRHQPRREQLIRARAFAQLGLLRMIHPDELTPERLRIAIDELLRTTPSSAASACLRLDGAREAARRMLQLAGQAGEFAPEGHSPLVQLSARP